MKKVFVLGIDGATLDLIEPWANQGKLPGFRKLMKSGSFGNCLSTIHPLTPQAWASFLTGRNPGKHGMFDFGARKPGTYELRLTTSQDRRAPALWNYVNSFGKKAGIINVPLTYPVEPLNGFMIGGMHTPNLKEGVYPEQLLDEILSKFPEYKIDVMSHWFDSYDIFLEKLWKMTEVRMDLTEYLYLKYHPELFVSILVGVDRVQHALWNQMDHPLEKNKKKNWKYSQAILRVYQQIDGFIERIINFLDDDDVFIIMSDHGFGSLEKDVYLNRFLVKNGFMKIKDKKWRKPFDMAKPFENIDWSSTKAYSYGLFGNIYLNVKGREPYGIVNKGEEYEREIDFLINLLYQLVNPDDGKKIIDKVYRREELYSGPFLEEAPDLLLVMRDYSYITRGGYEFLGESFLSSPQINHSGNHRMNGIAFFQGSDIKNGFRMNDIQITDLFPTILSAMEIPVPGDVDGCVVKDIFK